ncbi:MAG: hypothetical protein AAFX94_16060 [Myxococcota bacterium]
MFTRLPAAVEPKPRVRSEFDDHPRLDGQDTADGNHSFDSIVHLTIGTVGQGHVTGQVRRGEGLGGLVSLGHHRARPVVDGWRRHFIRGVIVAASGGEGEQCDKGGGVISH